MKQTFADRRHQSGGDFEGEFIGRSMRFGPIHKISSNCEAARIIANDKRKIAYIRTCVDFERQRAMVYSNGGNFGMRGNMESVSY